MKVSPELEAIIKIYASRREERLILKIIFDSLTLLWVETICADDFA
jgi:hypothetical protein